MKPPQTGHSISDARCELNIQRYFHTTREQRRDRLTLKAMTRLVCTYSDVEGMTIVHAIGHAVKYHTYEVARATGSDRINYDTAKRAIRKAAQASRLPGLTAEQAKRVGVRAVEKEVAEVTESEFNHV